LVIYLRVDEKCNSHLRLNLEKEKLKACIREDHIGKNIYSMFDDQYFEAIYDPINFDKQHL
jgi:hypothetical protein